MRYVFLLLITPLFLFAKSVDSCYSVQLRSFVIKDTSVYRFEDHAYPDGCILVRGEPINSVRCGCYEVYAKAQELQKELRTKYEQATVVTTYKRRFSVDARNGDISSASIGADDQELKLLFQVFSYSSDLENAYKTAKKALKAYPQSLYWHRKMAEVSQWTDRREEAVDHMMYVYRHTHNKALEDKILEYSLSAYQYKTAALLIEKKMRKNPNKENVQNMVYIFDLVGKPLESAEILDEVYRKDPSRKHLLTQQLQIYLNMGEMQRAKMAVQKIEKAGMLDMRSASLRSHYYFLRREIQASYEALQNVDIANEKEELTSYYMQLSDLSWYVQEYRQGAEASVRVEEAGQARLVDYERILAVYKKTDPTRARKVALDAYKKFSQHYLFYTYAYLAIDEKTYEELLDVCTDIESKKESAIVNEALYWMVKAEALAAMHRTVEAKEAFILAQSLDSNSYQIIQAYLWFLMDLQEDKALFELLLGLEERENLDSSLYLPMAVAYFSIQHGDRAAYYLGKLEEIGQEGHEISLLNAYVKQSQNEEGAFYKEMRSLYAQLQAEREVEPALDSNTEFMKTYLSVSMLFTGADAFDQELQRSRPVLKREDYNELSLSFALRENVDEQVRTMAQSLKRPAPWIHLTLALNEEDRKSAQDLVYRYYRTLPRRDSVSTAQNSKQISFAQSLVFEGLRDNEKDEQMYDQLRQLHNEYTDYFLTRTGYLDRTGLTQVYSDMHNSYYLAKGYSLEAELFLGSNSIGDDEIFKSIPSSSTGFGLGIKKRFERGQYEVYAGRKDSADSYTYFSFKYTTEISRRLSMEFLADKGAKAEESVYLLVGGYKDRLAMQAEYALLGSSQIGFYLESADYSSDDGKDLGSGVNGRVDFSYLQRSAYPDIRITPYYTFGDYTLSDGNRGVIEDMLNFPDTNVISDDFWYAGAEFSYGMENRYNYVRVWRPFFSVNPYYNGRESQFNYGFSAGLGGEVLGQDNLAVIVDYSESIGGTNDTLWRTYFRYKILY